jgi:ABC-type glycerol-3-phosphate transport system substrate-binding protein
MTCPTCHASVSQRIGTYHMPEGFAVVECPLCAATWRHLWGAGIIHNIRVYWYANRWFDESGVPHYFGIQTEEATIEEARQAVKFNVIAVDVDLVYGPCSLTELYAYLADVNQNSGEDVYPDVGTMDWLDDDELDAG